MTSSAGEALQWRPVAHIESLEATAEARWSTNTTLADTKLVARLWSVGAGGELQKHHHGADVHDLNDDGVVAEWSCSCGAGGSDFDNIGEASAAARDHWRDSLRAAIEATV
jgi:hypothetical protein